MDEQSHFHGLAQGGESEVCCFSMAPRAALAGVMAKDGNMRVWLGEVSFLDDSPRRKGLQSGRWWQLFFCPKQHLHGGVSFLCWVASTYFPLSAYSLC